MIVVDQKDHIGRVVLEPLLGILIPFEERLPIGLFGFAQIESRTNGGDVGGVNTG
jgi:hypothetical protein